MAGKLVEGPWWQRSKAGKVGVLAKRDGNVVVTRLFHVYPGLTEEAASNLLERSLRLSSAQIIIAGAGFICVGTECATKYRYPDEQEVGVIKCRAQRAAETIRDALPKNRPALCVGIDVYATCNRSESACAVGQFVAVILDSEILLVPKGYPTPAEASFLPIPENICRIVETPPLGRAAILVCHDVNAYSPRGTATATDEWRVGLRTAFLDGIKKGKPKIAFHHAHAMNTPRSFWQAYGEWAKRVDVPLVGVSGLDPEIDSADSASAIADSLLWPSEFPTIDLWETKT